VTTATYVRLSQNRGQDEDKPDRQRSQIASLLKKTTAVEYLDDDRSAYRGKKRPAWNRLLEDIEHGHVDRIVAAHMDRVLRSSKELVGLIDLADKHPFIIETAASGTLDLSQQPGRLQARLLVTFSESESERKADLHKSKAQQLREQGKSTGGARPFGWKSPNGELEPEEAEMIFTATRDLLSTDGRSLYSIRKQWNASGVTSSFGKPFRTNKDIARLLARYRNAGLVEHQGQVVGPAVWPAIEHEGKKITREDVEAVRQILSDPKRRTTPGPARKHLLSGIAVCGKEKCGHVLRKGTGPRHVDSYKCSSGKNCYLSIPSDLLETVVQSDVESFFMMADPAALAPSQEDRDQLSSLRAERAQIDRTRTDIAKKVGAGEWDMSMADMALQGSTARLSEIERTLAIIGSRLATAEMLMEPVIQVDAQGKKKASFERAIALSNRWKALSLDKKRAILREVYASIVVNPGRQREERIVLTRKSGLVFTGDEVLYDGD
jgi:site-specific DNA recombinase